MSISLQNRKKYLQIIMGLTSKIERTLTTQGRQAKNLKIFKKYTYMTNKNMKSDQYH